jgi:hypothetical protein
MIPEPQVGGMGHRVDTRSSDVPPSDRPRTYRIHHDIKGDGSLAETLVVHLDEITDVDLMSGEEVLSDYIDPDALDALFATPETDPEDNVAFTFADHRITVYATGHIYIEA